MIIRVGDRYWEAYGYAYFGQLYKDKGNGSKAIEYLRKAYEIFNSIGAHGHAQSVLNELKTLGFDLQKKEEPKKPENKKIEERQDRRKR